MTTQVFINLPVGGRIPFHDFLEGVGLCPHSTIQQHSFADPDGHQWELFHMSALPPQP